MANLLRPLLEFFLNHNVGRGLLVMSVLALLGLVLRGILTLLPGGAASTIQWTLLCGALATVVVRYVSLRASGRVRVFVGHGADLRRVFDRMPTAQRPPRPPIWAFGAHTQFAPWIVCNLLSAGLAPLRYEVQRLRVSGLADKTKPEGKTNPRNVDDVVVINYFPPTNAQKGGDSGVLALPIDAPTILVDPGLTCTAQDVPGSSLLRLAVSRGFRVVVVERRGHSCPLTKPRWNLFGDAEDTEQIVAAVRSKLPGAPFFWVGISSGSKLPIEAMGKFDQRRSNGDKSAPEFVATACVCPGYNLETCFLGFGFPYRHLCLSSVKSKFLLTNEDILREHNAEAYDRAVRAPDLQTLLTHAAPFAGYATAQEYFANENPVLFAPLITTPTLIINSMDDPCTVAKNAYGKMPGRDDGLTFVDMVERSQCGLLLMTPSGSHCPFLDGALWPFLRVPRALGWLTCASWADLCVLEFFEGFLAERRQGGSSEKGATPKRQ